ncbi:hypothetical protein FHS29_003513 [Saccharothrix tamanrassetensis]|uniref:Uncharacterized protein n=1 Tax=Saccharothrix tamanrassetensis TaxID=1051531 RepID=A0A841CIQ8_9PSEU|nr:hypothetical protein [Saccharothrix tamanrassetensis]MBB5956920.1 hypothetical protein [Saccharothrix tamanrassetensis]
MGTSPDRVGRGRRAAHREPRRAPVRRTGPPPRRGRRLLTPLRVLLCVLTALVVTAVVKLVQPTTTPPATAGLALALGALPLVVDLLRELPEVRARGTGPGPLVGAALVLLVLGGGVAYGIAALVDRITAHESVLAERLATLASGEVGPLTATVEQVAVTENFTKVTVAAVNRSSLAAKVSVVDSCRLIRADGTELRLNGLFEVVRERFFLDVPGGGAVVRATLSFPGTLPDGETTATLGCGSVSWNGDDPAWRGRDFVGRSLRVPDLRLTAVR